MSSASCSRSVASSSARSLPNLFWAASWRSKGFIPPVPRLSMAERLRAPGARACSFLCNAETYHILKTGMPTPHLILVPGLMCDETVWTHQARQLATLTTVTIADHGSCDSLGKMAEAILEGAPARFAIAGHSMGGRVTLEVFRRARDRVAGMILMDTAYAPRREGVAGEREAEGRYGLLDIARKEGTRAMGAIWVQRMVHPSRLADTALLDSILDMIGRKSANIFGAQIKALLERPDATPLLAQIHCPTVVLCGRQDTWAILSQHEQMSAQIPGSRLVVIEECGHMSTMERPAEVTAAMRSWLTSLSV